MTMCAAETLELGKRFVEALCRRDPPDLLAVLHDKFVMAAVYPLVPGVDRAGAKTCAGEAVREFVRQVPKVLSKVQFHNVVWRTTDDGLAVFEADGDMAYADGRPYKNNYLWMFESADGKLTLLKEYFNPMIWARACGAPFDSLP
jgi:ketosteroid isomerase-like protein